MLAGDSPASPPLACSGLETVILFSVVTANPAFVFGKLVLNNTLLSAQFCIVLGPTLVSTPPPATL